MPASSAGPNRCFTAVEDPQGVVAVAVERENGVDHMLHRSWAGQVAVLGHVTDQQDRDSGRLGQSGHALDPGSDLGHAAGRLGQGGVGHGLHRVDDDQGWVVLLDGGFDCAEVGTLEGQQLGRHRADA